MSRNNGCRIAAVVLSVAVLGSIFGLVAIGASSPGHGQAEQTLERLSEVLKTLEAELSALEAPRAERLEEGLEQITELIATLLEEFDRPREDRAALSKARIVRLDLMLHRLVDALEQLLAADDVAPARLGMQDALEDLRLWVEGYIEGLTAGLDPRISDRLERAAHQMVRDLARQLSELAKGAMANAPEHPKLAHLVGQLNGLLQRLDHFIRRNFRPVP